MQALAEHKTVPLAESPSPWSVVTLQVTAELAYRELATRTVALVCKVATTGEHNFPSGYREELGHQLVSAVGEAFNNVVLHGYRDRTPGTVTLVISFDTERVRVEVKDFGASFDLAAVKPPDLAALPESGLGLYIIQSFIDELQYTPGSPNVLTMTKYLIPA